LRLRHHDLLATNRRWQVPAIGLGLGVSSLIAGGILFATSWDSYSGSCYSYDYDYHGCDYDDGYNRTREAAGLVMMPLGALLVLASAPMLAVRVVRHRKLKRVERSLGFLVQHASLGTGRGNLAFRF